MEACHYHRNNNISWSCPGCHTCFCTRCIPGGESNFHRGEPRCPSCATSLHWQGSEPAEPLWRRGGDFFRYAARWPLVLMALFAGWIWSRGWFLPGLFMQGFLLCYGLMVVAAVSRDDWTLPSFREAASNVDLMLRQVAAVILLFLGPMAVMSSSPVMGWLTLISATIAFPATVMILASTGSLKSALNPLLWFQTIWILGWRYLLVWLVLLTVSSAPDWFYRMFPGAHQLPVFYVLLGGLTFYSSIVIYVVMGYAMLEQAEQLGLLEEMERGRDLSPDQFEKRQAIAKSYIYCRNGRLDEARSVIRQAIQSFPRDRELHGQLHDVLLLRKKAGPLSQHADEYIQMLFAQGYGGLATSVYRDTRKVIPDYRPDASDLCHQLADQCVGEGRWRDAARLLVNMHRRDAGYEKLADAYLLLAEVYLQGLNNVDSASRLMGWLKSRYPDVMQSERAVRLAGMISA